MRISDWSSDVCSSDLMADILPSAGGAEVGQLAAPPEQPLLIEEGADHHLIIVQATRSHPQILAAGNGAAGAGGMAEDVGLRHLPRIAGRIGGQGDRKSTRLNSSH